jgi:hypothetical protein
MQGTQLEESVEMHNGGEMAGFLSEKDPRLKAEK